MSNETPINDPLYVAGVLRQRVAYVNQFEPGAHRMTFEINPIELPFGLPATDTAGKHDHTLSAQGRGSVHVYQRELEVILKAVESPNPLPARVTLPAGYRMNCEPGRYLSVNEVAHLLRVAGIAVDQEEADD